MLRAFNARPRRIVFAAFALVALLAAITLFLRPKRELIVRGKPVSQWALALRGPGSIQPAEEVIGSLGPEAVPDLLVMLRTRDSVLSRPLNATTRLLPMRVSVPLHRVFKPYEPPQRRLAAALALKLIGTNAVSAMPDLLQALRDSEPSVSMVAGMALSQFGEASLPGLIEALDDPGFITRSSAMYGLYFLGSAARPAIPRLVAALNDSSDRLHAVNTLLSIGNPVLPALIEVLNSPSDPRRPIAIELLGTMGLAARSTIPVLAALATNGSVTVRTKAVEAVGKICNSCPTNTAILENALSDQNLEIRRIASSYLSCEPRVALGVVDRLLKQIEIGNTAEQQSAIANLGFMGKAAHSAIPFLKTISVGQDAALSDHAKNALRQIEEATGRAE